VFGFADGDDCVDQVYVADPQGQRLSTYSLNNSGNAPSKVTSMAIGHLQRQRTQVGEVTLR
jgi:hypothetical protein